MEIIAVLRLLQTGCVIYVANNGVLYPAGETSNHVRGNDTQFFDTNNFATNSSSLLSLIFG